MKKRTETGRAQCEPHMQNVPVRTALGEEVRRAFVEAHFGALPLSVDFSAIELRILREVLER